MLRTRVHLKFGNFLTMADLYHFLLVEDRLSDAELIVLELKRSGFQFKWQRVDREDDYINALMDGPDVIIADYVLPQFDANICSNDISE